MLPFLDLKPQYQALKPAILDRIGKVLEHGQFILGPEVAECEAALSEFLGIKHLLTCANGTDALMLALMAKGIGPGDEVIVPAFSFFATAEAVSLVGATPRFVDIEPETYNLDPKLLKGAINKKSKAIIPVGLYGQPADMDEISEIAKAHGLTIIEDAAQSFGSRYKGKRSGFADMSCTSFFPAKPLGCYGDGGAIYTNDDELAAKLRMLRAHGESSRYQHDLIGMNGRLDTLQCAVLLVKLPRFEWEIEQRNRWAERYSRLLSPARDKIRLPQIKDQRLSVWAQYTIHVPEREVLKNALGEKGVPTAIHYPVPIPGQKAYGGMDLKPFPHSQWAASGVLSLPLYADMSEAIQDQIVNALLSLI